MQWFKASMLAAGAMVVSVMAMAESPIDTKADVQKAADQFPTLACGYRFRSRALAAPGRPPMTSLASSPWRESGASPRRQQSSGFPNRRLATPSAGSKNALEFASWPAPRDASLGEWAAR